MKKSKLKKIIEETISEYNKSTENTSPYTTSNKYLTVSNPTTYEDPMSYYEEEISENFYKFAIRAGKATDKFTTSTSSERMTITGHIGNDTIDIIIHKKGFRINRYNSSGMFTLGNTPVKHPLSYNDDKMFDRLSPFLNSIKQESHKEAFLNEIDEICISTKLSRESNLEELLNEENNDDKC